MDRFHPYPVPFCLWRYQHRQRLRIIKSNIEKMPLESPAALDAGAGKGPYTYVMTSQFKKVYSFEYSPSELERLRTNVAGEFGDFPGHVETKQVDLQKIPLPDSSVDFIVCSEVLEHIPDYDEAMSELYRVAAPGAKVVFSMPNRYGLFWLYDKFMFYFVKLVKKILGREEKPREGYNFWELNRHWSFSPRQIRGIAKKAGFRRLKSQGTSVLIYNEKLMKFVYSIGALPLVEKLDNFLGRIFPGSGAFYFMILERPSGDE
jgi:ubiquinone/menaquinone biosynthesis C-methylase UbiE